MQDLLKDDSKTEGQEEALNKSIPVTDATFKETIQKYPLAMEYQIMGIPAMLIFKNGKLIDQVIGAMPRQILEPKIVKYL